MSEKLYSNGKVKISFDIPEKFLLELDAERKKLDQNRSTWLTLAVMDRLAKIRKEEENNVNTLE